MLSKARGRGTVRFNLVAVVSDSLRPHGLQHARPPVHHQLLQFTQTHVHWVSDAIQPPHPLSSPSPPTFNLSQDRVFSNESVFCIRWPKYWSFSFSISPSNEYSWLISFRMNWLGFLVVQGTLKSLLQHRSLKASILRYSTFYMIQLSHPYITTGKIIDLTRRTFVGKLMSLHIWDYWYFCRQSWFQLVLHPARHFT